MIKEHHTAEQPSLMHDEGNILFSTWSTSSSFSFNVEVDGGPLYCEKVLLIQKHL